MRELVRPEVRSVVEYTLTERPFRIKLNQNENPYELPPGIKREILDRMAAERWSRYPPFVPGSQTEQLAQFTGWKSDGILLGNGSNELLQLIFTCVLDARRSVVISQPTFTLYKLLAQGLGAAVHDVPMLPGFRFDTDAIIETAVWADASMIVLCSPNNPTGTQIPGGEVVRILSSTGALVLVDEAYVQFAPFSLMSLLRDHRNLVLLQTFSKAMGAAGLRFGYALADPALARQLYKVKLPYAVNTFTLIAAEVVMKRWDEVRGWLVTLQEERERVRQELGNIPGIVVHESAANFLLFESLQMAPADLFGKLCAEGILIRDVSGYPQLVRGLRVSIGTPGENDEFIKAMRRAR